ncbi:MAG: anthranilate synthase component I family protein [Candidatus Peregrinibacteria bacterium]|nr:anthranilate synthase component I family protein [Candidatus Peregrinibacteria bacterium]
MKSTFDLASYSESAKKEGFAVLHAGQDGKWTTVLSGPKKKLSRIPEKPGSLSHVGYMAYPNPKLKNQIPDARFYAYQNSITYNHKKGASLATLQKDYKSSGKLEQSVTKSEYIKKIKEIKELLAAGEVYQINYAIRFRKKFEGSPYSLYLKLIHENPTNFSVFLNCGDFQIVSNSPERLFKVEKGMIVTQPIKGTAAKLTANRSPLSALLNSEKERAELDMITDLERNDIGKICKYGTLKLSKEREVMELSNLYHTYSEVTGKLPRGILKADIVKAMFPGGSVTGCPKKRAMEYIEKLEKLPRNIFTGSIFYLGQGIIDSSICIRTALIRNGYIEYWAGGGIVADSDPEAEYAECQLKASTFLGIL